MEFEEIKNLVELLIVESQRFKDAEMLFYAKRIKENIINSEPMNIESYLFYAEKLYRLSQRPESYSYKIPRYIAKIELIFGKLGIPEYIAKIDSIFNKDII